MKKIYLMLVATSWVAQAFSAALTVINGGFQAGAAGGGCSTSPLYQYASGWHGLIVEYYNGQCNSSTNYIDYSTGPTYPFLETNCASYGSGYNGTRFAVSLHQESGPGSPIKNFNFLIFQQMGNTATAGTAYRATAFVKGYSGFGVQGVLGIGFVNTSVGYNANNIAANLRAQAGFLPTPSYTSVGNGWYKMTVDWTPPSTGSYYIVIGYTSLCTDFNANSSTWLLDEVSITCKADAGVDKSNLDRNCCAIPQYTSVQIGTYNATPGLTYSWNNTSSLSCSTCQQPVATPHGTTDYTLTVAGLYCLAGTDVVRVTTNTNVKYCCAPPTRMTSESSISGIVVYPNPTSGLFNISIDDGAGTVDQIRVCDLQGKIVFERSNAEKTILVDLSGYSNGTYIISVNDGDKQTTRNLIKE